MAKNNDTVAVEFIDLIKDLIHNEIAKTDATILCRVAEVNQDGTFNLSIVPDFAVTLKNIKSISPEDLEQDDYVYVYKFNNQLSNAVILTTVGTKANLNSKSKNDANGSASLDGIVLVDDLR